MANKAALTAAAFTALAFNGLTYTFMGTCLPAIQSHLQLHIDLAGALMAALQTGVTIFSLIGGILSDYLPRERVLMAGCVLIAVAAALFGTVPSFAANLIIVGLMGAGMGCILSGSNTLLAGLYPDRKGTILNIHHVFFSIGALAGPLVMGYLITQANQWRAGFIIESAVVLILAIIFYFSGGHLPQFKGSSLLGRQMGKMLHDRNFLVILAINALTTGTQVTVMFLGVTFLIQAKQIPLAVAGAALSLFSVFMVVGRLVCSRLTQIIPHATIIFNLLGLQLAILILAWQGTGWLAVAALAFSGFTFSGIYPTSLAVASILFPQQEGSALGILSTIGGLGGVIFCWLTGYVAGLTDLNSGFLVMIAACCLALLLLGINHGALCRRESQTDLS